MNTQLRIKGSGPLRGSLRVPADKSIGHRALICAAVARGKSEISGYHGALDHEATRQALAELGARSHVDVAAHTVTVDGVGPFGLTPPSKPLDCGNSGTTMRLLSGLLAAQSFASELVGDASLSRRPMGRVASPLRARGACIRAREHENKLFPPVVIRPPADAGRLAGIEYDMPIASAQVKSALLLSGLYADGPTVLREPMLSRDHTERMLTALGVPLDTAASMVALPAGGAAQGWSGFRWALPADPSSAAFAIVAALLCDGSSVALRDVCTNPTRIGLLQALSAMGACLEVESRGQLAGDEPVAVIKALHGPLRATKIGGELLLRMIDEVPIFCAAAAVADGTTEIHDAAELRVKESDRLSVMASVLRAFGVECAERPDGLRIVGRETLKPARVRSHGDHRIAMTAAVLATRARGESIVEDADCIRTSYPTFVRDLRALGAEIAEEEQG